MIRSSSCFTKVVATREANTPLADCWGLATTFSPLTNAWEATWKVVLDYLATTLESGLESAKE